ncbi:MAG: tetratricopeptide repeat protein, partial [Bacteroides sp.]
MKFKVGLIVLVLFMLEANLNLLGVTHKKLLNDSLSLDLVNESPSRKYTYYFLEAVGQKNIGRMDDAFILFNRCIELNPNSAEAYYQLATLHMNNNQSESGIKMFQTAVALDSLNYWYNESLYFALYSNPARSKEALQHLEKMTERFPSKTALQFQLLESYTQGDQLGKAITVLNRLESQVGKSEQLTLQKFKIYLLMGDEKQAVDEICELIKA